MSESTPPSGPDPRLGPSHVGQPWRPEGWSGGGSDPLVRRTGTNGASLDHDTGARTSGHDTGARTSGQDTGVRGSGQDAGVGAIAQDAGIRAPGPDAGPDDESAGEKTVGQDAEGYRTGPVYGDGVPGGGGDDQTGEYAEPEDLDGADDDGADEAAPEPADLLARLSGLLGGIGTGAIQVRGQNATGHGSMAIGAINIGGVDSAGGGRIWSQTLTVAAVKEMAAGYAPGPGDGVLDARLRQRAVVCLAGRPGTGRYTTACLALARRHAADRVGVLVADRLTDLIGPASPLRADTGYLLRLEGDVGFDGLTLVGLAARAERLGSTLILVGDFDRSDREIAGDLVEHRPALAREVFQARLRHRLSGNCLDDCRPCDGTCVRFHAERCAGVPALRAYLGGRPRPVEVVWLADRIAADASRVGDLPALLDRLLPEQLRQRAREILNPTPEESMSVADRGGGDYLRAVRLSCAVLAGHPFGDIHRVARRLVGPVSEAGIAGLRQPDLGLLLGEPLRRAVTLADEGGTRPGDRTVRFAEAEAQLPTNLLDVAWLDWGAPDRLLDWLAGLVTDEEPAVRQAAAGALGWAGGRNLTAALSVVQTLSRNRRNSIRQAAGIALVAMAMQPDLRRRVRVEMDRWAEGTAFPQDTVARAYALGLGRLWPDTALAQLRRVARTRMQRYNNSVVRGLVEVYQSDGGPRRVVGELVDWAGPPDRWLGQAGHEVRLHAARTLRVLADRRSPAPDEQWPELLLLIRIGTLSNERVATLWALALSLPETAHRAWRTLGYWLNRADGHPEVEQGCLDLLRATITDRPLRRRLDHQIRHVWRPIMPSNQLLFRVSRLTIEE
nr:HEAT repeat domain-containing protein [Micromonospora sp. DSM 115978]